MADKAAKDAVSDYLATTLAHNIYTFTCNEARRNTTNQTPLCQHMVGKLENISHETP